MDTGLSGIVDLAPSPAYSRDGTIFLLTFGDSRHSLWRSLTGAAAWERVFSGHLSGVDAIDMVRTSPRYGNGGSTLYLAGSSGGRPVIWRSADSGRSFTPHPAYDPETGDQLAIDALAVAGEDELFIASFDGARARVYRSDNGGFFYTRRGAAGTAPLTSLAVSPDYERDGVLLAGTGNGWVYLSRPGGDFEPLPGDAAAAPLAGSISLAFDREFARNGLVYAASSTAGKGVYRFRVGKATAWESIDGTLPAGATLNQVVVSAAGALYAANSAAGDGMERSLEPDYSLSPSFQTVNRGLSGSAALYGLWGSGSRLWAGDGSRLLTFHDSLNQPVRLALPADQVSGLGKLVDHEIRDIVLDWQTLDGAESYDWSVDTSADFAAAPSAFEGSTRSGSVRLSGLEPGVTYHWRVRAAGPLPGPWSAKRSFTTLMDTEPAGFKLQAPGAGASLAPVRPLFQWDAVAGASAYELLVAAVDDFSAPVIARLGEAALPANAWSSNVTLEHGTAYYWKVRAVGGSASDWSPVSVFTTEPAPLLPASLAPAASQPSPALSPSPAAPAQSGPLEPLSPSSLTAAPPQSPPPAAPTPAEIAPAWFLYLVGALLFIIVFLLVIVLVLVLRHGPGR